MPIEDSMLLFEHGNPKEARYVCGVYLKTLINNRQVLQWCSSHGISACQFFGISLDGKRHEIV